MISMTFCIFILAAISLAKRYDDRVLLQDVKAITLRRGEWTQARRGSPIKQLNCVQGACATEYQPSVVQCVNVGSDGTDAQWKCDAELDNRVKFGNIEVSCEGYDSPDDPYITKGSCGLEYELKFTGNGGYQQQQQQYRQTTYSTDDGFGFGTVVKFLVLLFTIYVCTRICCGSGRNITPVVGGTPVYQQPYYSDPIHPPVQPHPVVFAAQPVPVYPTPGSVSMGTAAGMAAASGAMGYAAGRASAQPSGYTPYAASTYVPPAPSSGPSSSSNTHTSTGFGGTKRR